MWRRPQTGTKPVGPEDLTQVIRLVGKCLCSLRYLAPSLPSPLFLFVHVQMHMHVEVHMHVSILMQRSVDMSTYYIEVGGHEHIFHRVQWT